MRNEIDTRPKKRFPKRISPSLAERHEIIRNRPGIRLKEPPNFRVGPGGGVVKPIPDIRFK